MKAKSLYLLNKHKMVLVLIGLLVICTLASPFFLTVSNILNVARQISIIGILSVGMTFVILTGGIDLSIGPTMALTTVLIALLSGCSGIVAVLAALAVGFLVGIANGSIIAYLNVQAFIVTLGMMSVLKGIGLTIAKGSPITGVPQSILFLGRGKLFGTIPGQVIIFICVAIVATVILKYTSLGRYTYAIGGNPEATRLSGINVKRYTMLIYGISGLLAGLAGILMATQLNMGEARLGDGYEMDAIAAVVIGGTSLKGGVGTVGGTIIGILIIGFLGNLLNLMDVPSYTQLIFKGAIIVIAATMQTERKPGKC
ncbi:MAG: ABC transporter permease [Parabacteroides sp.]|nr:ABC transporter permease [Parabacteroides sp.]